MTRLSTEQDEIDIQGVGPRPAAVSATLTDSQWTLDTPVLECDRRRHGRFARTIECSLGRVLNVGLGGALVESRELPPDSGHLTLSAPRTPAVHLAFRTVGRATEASPISDDGEPYRVAFTGPASAFWGLAALLAPIEMQEPSSHEYDAPSDVQDPTRQASFEELIGDLERGLADARDYLSSAPHSEAPLDDALAPGIPERLAAYEMGLMHRVHHLIERLGERVRDVNGDARAELVGTFRERLQAYVSASAFFERADRKPLGYAGDFGMMDLLYRGRRYGNDLWARICNSILTSIPLGEAVRERAYYLKAMIERASAGQSEEPARILSVACGSGEEVRLFLSSGGGGAAFTLLDQDEHALDFAGRRMRERRVSDAPAPVRLERASVRDLLRRRWRSQESGGGAPFSWSTQQGSSTIWTLR